jgi:hypothetical protein
VRGGLAEAALTPARVAAVPSIHREVAIDGGPWRPATIDLTYNAPALGDQEGARLVGLADDYPVDGGAAG